MELLRDRLAEPWLSWLLLVLVTAVALATALHALLFKRDPRSALGWIGVSLLFPLAGPLLYFLFGVNRIRTRARKLRLHGPFHVEHRALQASGSLPESLARVPGLAALARTGDAVSRYPIVAGNAIEVLHNGEQAFPRMLEAIAGARRSVFLASYIFESNATGRRFIDALAAAAARGVDVRVLIDGVGERYSFPSASRLLRRRGVEVRRFLPPRLFPPAVHINLRNHRKILVADGREAFTGGMNIGDRHLVAAGRRNPVVDAHFRLSGPVVEQIRRVFLDDWAFVTGGDRPAPEEPRGDEPPGDSLCRVIVDGPNEDIDKLPTVLIGAVSWARRSVSVMTPYFLPPRELSVALEAAALRGVDVAVVLPARNNLPFVHWATRNMLWELLQRGVRVYYRPGPFAHTKLFLVDGQYAQIGSANLDPRSLRLNFELTVEVFDAAFTESLQRHFDAVRGESAEVSLEELDRRPLPIRVRDAAAWLFTPYL